MKLKRGRTTHAGFTLIEILVVVSLTAILLAMVAPRINLGRIQADTAAHTVRGSLLQAHRRAIQTQHDILVSFDVAKNRVRIVQDLNNNATAEATDLIAWQSLQDGAKFTTPATGLSGSATGPVVGTNVKTVDGYPTITFRRDGAASSDLEVYVTSSRAQPGDVRGLKIIQSTGRVDWFRLVDGIWRKGAA